MKDWPVLQQLLAESLVSFLGKSLSEVGGENWWRFYVLDCLTPAQLKAAQSITEGDLGAFDLAALLRVADRNWAEVALKLSLRREMRNLVIELKDVRNRYAHATLRGVDVEDQLRDVDTARRLMQAIGAEELALREVNAIHRRLLLQVAQAQSEQEPDDGSESTPRDTPAKPAFGTANAASSAEQEESLAPGSPPDRARPDVGGGDPEFLEAEPGKGGWIVNPESPGNDVTRALETRTYVGIDFGTSTTVVSIVRLDAQGRLVSKTLPIRQPAELGGSISYHLVNTVLAWHDNQLLFGRDAYRLRQELFEGRNVFSSFKMRLGIDVGPTYPETVLRRGALPLTIENANDAAREFFRLLRIGIDEAIDEERLPADVRFAVSVPASFEANQRRDLLRSMKEAGFPADDICLIDEPNAAFLSFLHASVRGEADKELLDRLRRRGANVLVYDFGAGTCDVSILNVRVGDRDVRSRNLAISRFTALGGDDLDRAIAQQALLPQLIASAPGFTPEQRDTEERLIPRLQPTAERLKLAAIEWLTHRGVTTLQGVRQHEAETFTDQQLPAFKIRARSLSLNRPSMTLGQFADALEPFVSQYDPDVSSAHIFAPVANALEKSGLKPGQLDAILFIGGSAANPIVRTAVMQHLPAEVQAIIPSDLRTHVSLGAALHGFGFHACGMDLIRPITSESIYVITRGGRLEAVIPAGAEVPTPTPFVTRLRVDRNGQSIVELPVCVGSESKLVGLLTVQAESASGFMLGDEVIVSARITHDKLLDVEATAGGITVRAGLLNPLANRELTPAETSMLEAKQRFNIALLESQGHPSKDVVLAYAEAALAAEAFELAAEMYMATERLDPAEDHATNICYALARAGRTEASKAWARRAYKRRPDALTAYNLSCHSQGEEREQLLRESLRLNGNLPCTLLSLGRLLVAREDANGKGLLEKAVRLMDADLRRHVLSKDNCRQLAQIARELGLEDVAARAQARFESLGQTRAYEESNLAASTDGQQMIIRG
jgi:molecular chaperone DnaK